MTSTATAIRFFGLIDSVRAWREVLRTQQGVDSTQEMEMQRMTGASGNVLIRAETTAVLTDEQRAALMPFWRGYGSDGVKWNEQIGFAMV
jgi:hypothetical protein